MGTEIALVVQGGTPDGIKTDWHAVLIDASGQQVKGLLRIVEVRDDRTILRASVTRDQVKGKRVLLTPPK
jgi:hypothetical protein